MLSQLAKLWKCSTDRAEDALRNDADHARRVLSRRQLFGVAAALACPLSEPTKAFVFYESFDDNYLVNMRQFIEQVNQQIGLHLRALHTLL